MVAKRRRKTSLKRASEEYRPIRKPCEFGTYRNKRGSARFKPFHTHERVGKEAPSSRETKQRSEVEDIAPTNFVIIELHPSSWSSRYREIHWIARNVMKSNLKTDMYEQTTTFGNAFTAGSIIEDQIEGDLNRILEKATNASPHNRVALEINVQNSLHLIQSRWDELVVAGKTSKRRFQDAAFSAVGKPEHEESEQELRNLVEQLKQHVADLESLIAVTDKDVALTARAAGLKADIHQTERKLAALYFDVRFLTARTLSDRLEVAPWGVSPSQQPASGTSERRLTNATLASFATAIDRFTVRVDSRYGPADWSEDATAEVMLVNDDETRKLPIKMLSILTVLTIIAGQASGERQPRWSDEEWLEVVNIEHFHPEATSQMKADMLNDCMAARRARQGVRKPLDRSAAVLLKQLRGELRDMRAE